MSTTIANTSAPAAPASGPSSKSQGTAPSSRWLRHLPNIVVFSLLGAVLLFGHFSGWKLDHFGTLFGSAAAPPDDWCAEHLVPESQCVECNEKLLPKPKEYGFCRQHGVAECVICHPELAQVNGEPELPQYDTVAAIGVTDRPVNNSRSTLHKHRVQFASTASADKAGVDVDVVATREMSDAITANGELTFDPTRVAHLSSRAPGTVAFVFKTIGDQVEPDEVLALVDVAQVGQAKSALLQAIVQQQLRRTSLTRLEAAADGIAAKTITEARAALQEAEVTYISARQALANLGFEVPETFEQTDTKKIADELRFLGVPEDLLATLPPATKSANLYPVRAPYSGVIVAAECVVGEVVSATSILYTLADPSRIWLTLAVRQEDARHVKPGLPVNFQPDDGSAALAGRITWMSPAIDPRTRTLQVRVELEHGPEGLKDKTFGTGRIVLREQPKAVVVPRAAVQTTPEATVIFVRDRNYLREGAPKVFYPRQVRVGAQDGEFVELLAGALPGEVVATGGSSVLLAQLLRSNLGAGCGCHEK